MIKTSPFFKSGKGKTDVALRKLASPVLIFTHKKVTFWIREEHIKKIGKNKSKSVFHVCSHVNALIFVAQSLPLSQHSMTDLLRAIPRSGSSFPSFAIITSITAFNDRFTLCCASIW